MLNENLNCSDNTNNEDTYNNENTNNEDSENNNNKSTNNENSENTNNENLSSEDSNLNSNSVAAAASSSKPIKVDVEIIDDGDEPRSRSDDYDAKSSYTSELPLFSHVKLPYNFLAFALPPYSLNLAETNSLTALCLLTNTVISISKTAASNANYISLGAHLTKLGGTTLLLLLNGPFSTSIAVASNEFSFVVKIISPYVNDYGDEDPGFVTGRMLTLSRERLERAYDIYLSGEGTKYIPK